MNKRQKKKVGTRYHLLRQAQRQAQKRKGEKCIAYEIVEIGKSDMVHKDGFGTEYAYGTHWIVKVLHRKSVYFGKEHTPYQTIVYPCTSHGTGDSNAALHVIFHWREKSGDMIPFFERIVDDMKQDRYWEADY
ncbi:hypothetical protein QTL97_17135 [Sporosarcina thermotolerans]|uniref:Uncharacterized protein n=1 Tax=Sporosarcina thermotolerans TaxID=633404 RepID=A0AAW9AAH6_9BACL|nr:hypothetical protein [Sporosarcina thermotolerans]MDW0118651.1 hypothetical protein [Sporosarcina thermotolerans]WHT49557.1 hypothetical protein QNH10_08630 [Sporosarcina thermotolerans]